MAELRPLDLQSFDGPLYVKNKTNTRISHDDSKGNRLVLSPAGSEGDLAALPKEVANHTGFQKLWRRGAVVVSSDETLEEALAIHEKDEENDLSKWLGGSASMGDDPAKSSLVQVSCPDCSQTDFLSAEKAQENQGVRLCGIEGSTKSFTCPKVS